MPRDILSEFGDDTSQPQTGRGQNQGGPAKDLPYSPPSGPKGQGHEGPGLGGTNHGTCGTQGRR